MGITALYALLCRALIEQRRPAAVSETIDAAQKIGRETSELLFEAEFYRLKARSLLIDGPPYERSSADIGRYAATSKLHEEILPRN
jgi:hypothetical protein